MWWSVARECVRAAGVGWCHFLRTCRADSEATVHCSTSNSALSWTARALLSTAARCSLPSSSFFSKASRDRPTPFFEAHRVAIFEIIEILPIQLMRLAQQPGNRNSCGLVQITVAGISSCARTLSQVWELCWQARDEVEPTDVNLISCYAEHVEEQTRGGAPSRSESVRLGQRGPKREIRRRLLAAQHGQVRHGVARNSAAQHSPTHACSHTHVRTHVRTHAPTKKQEAKALSSALSLLRSLSALSPCGSNFPAPGLLTSILLNPSVPPTSPSLPPLSPRYRRHRRCKRAWRSSASSPQVAFIRHLERLQARATAHIQHRGCRRRR